MENFVYASSAPGRIIDKNIWSGNFCNIVAAWTEFFKLLPQILCYHGKVLQTEESGEQSITAHEQL